MKPEGILQSCLDDVLAGRKTPAECAALFPQIPNLESQLRVAIVLREAQGAVPRPGADRRIEARLRQGASALRATRRPAVRARWSPAALRWAAALSLIVSLLLAGVGTAAASNNSLPGEPLYAVKRAVESLESSLTPPAGQAGLHAAFAQRRLDEITAVYQRGTVEGRTLADLAGDLVIETEAALTSVENSAPERQPEILSALILMTEQQQTVLATVRASAPPEAQAGLDRALEASSQGHQRALERLEQVGSPTSRPGSPTPHGGGPSPSATSALLSPTQAPPGQTQVPPGQTKIPPGQTQAPPGQTQVPPGQTKIPPGQTQVPPGQTKIPPGQTQATPGQTQVPPGQAKVRPTPGGPSPCPDGKHCP